MRTTETTISMEEITQKIINKKLIEGKIHIQ